MDIRKIYHALEKEMHGKEWTSEEDALAFLTAAALIGRLVMAKEGRWPSSEESMLPSKIGECVWWLYWRRKMVFPSLTVWKHF